MGRFSASTIEEDAETGIDMSPLIDCVFILLIFFIVTTVFVEEPGVEVNKPQAVSAERLEKNSILIAITANGEIVYGGRDIGVTGVQPMIKRMLSTGEQLPIIIQGDLSARHGVITKVMEQIKLAAPDATVNLASRL